jgi:MFS family permease
MALTNLAVFGGAFFTPILVGKITHTIGWPWTFYLVAIFTGVCLPFVIFCVPETAYRRAAHLNTDMASSEPNTLLNKSENMGHELVDHTLNQPDHVEPAINVANASQGNSWRKYKFVQNLGLFSGRKTDDRFFTLFLRPFPLFFHPAVLWTCLIQGAMIGWTVFIGIILAALFLGPPLFWNEERTGYAYTGAFLGAIFGFLFAGASADWSAKFMTRKNNGIYEPEFRILLVIPQFVFGCSGLFLFGITASRLVDYHWIWPVFAFGLEVCGMVIGAVAASLYIVDAHREIAIEAFTCTIIFKAGEHGLY